MNTYLQLPHKIKQNPGLLFLIKVLSFYIVWNIIFRLWINESSISYQLSELLGITSGYLFELAGYSVTLADQTISLNNMPLIHIGNSCNGLEFFGLFACFVLAFPASLKSKMVILPLGILMIHVLNMIRVQLLILNFYFYNATFDLNHKYTFNVVIYGIMLLLWVYWAKKQMKKGVEQHV